MGAKQIKDSGFFFKNIVFFSIHVDAVIQHMTGGFEGTGSDGSNFNGEAQSYPAVPYENKDFHYDECPTASKEIEVSVTVMTL